MNLSLTGKEPYSDFGLGFFFKFLIMCKPGYLHVGVCPCVQVSEGAQRYQIL